MLNKGAWEWVPVEARILGRGVSGGPKEKFCGALDVKM